MEHKRYFRDGFHLFDHQVPSARALCQRRRALLVDGTGSGKTLTCLYSFAYLQSRGVVTHMLVWTPLNAHTKRIWEKDATKYSFLKCLSFDDYIAQRSKGVSVETLLSRYDVIYGKHGHVKTAFNWMQELYAATPRSITCIDEVHKLSNPKTELVSTFKPLLNKAYAFWGITATLLSKNVLNVYNLVNLVYPKYFRSYKFFLQEFCKVEERVIGKNVDGSLKKVRLVTDYKDPDKLKEYLSSVMITGVPPVDAKVHLLDYTMGDRERVLYEKISKGLLAEAASDETWLEYLLSGRLLSPVAVPSVKSLDRHSSRFIYLQSVVDGSLDASGKFGVYGSAKSEALLNLCRDIAQRNESALIYCDYYTSVDVVLDVLRKGNILDGRGHSIMVMESSSRKQLSESALTENVCRSHSCFCVITRATSESANYPFISNVIFYSVPVVPVAYAQAAGRICRRNSKFLGNLHIWILRSENIDTYKLVLVGFKIYMMKEASVDFQNFPEEYIKSLTSAGQLALAKRHLLWGAYRNKK